jgi:rhomboid protease GluP
LAVGASGAISGILGALLGLLTIIAGMMLAPVLSSDCAPQPLGAGGLVEILVNAACTDRQMTIGIIAACAYAATMLLYSQELVRGIKDVGFVGASLRAERKRRQGI